MASEPARTTDQRSKGYEDQQEKDQPDPRMPSAAIRHDARSVLLEQSSVCFTLSPTAIATTGST